MKDETKQQLTYQLKEKVAHCERKLALYLQGADVGAGPRAAAMEVELHTARKELVIFLIDTFQANPQTILEGIK